jgi:hypothetical protein
MTEQTTFSLDLKTYTFKNADQTALTKLDLTKLEELDAFLACLNGQLEAHVLSAERPITAFLAEVAKAFSEHSSTAELNITQTLDTSTNSLNYSFKFCMEKRDANL